MANIFKHVQLSTKRIALIISLIIFICALMFLRNGFPSPLSPVQPDEQAIPQQEQPVMQKMRCIYNSALPASSPLCSPHIMLGSRPMLITTLPESGVCSIEQAKRAPTIDIDFSRYLKHDFITEPLWRMQWHEGATTVALPIAIFDSIKILSSAVSNDDQLTYAISLDSYESLKKSIPSLSVTMASIGNMTETYYVTSHRCLPLVPIPE